MSLCSIPSCRRSCGPRYLMCREHWSLVPLPLQRTIWRLWNEGKIREGYAEARDSAIEQVLDALRDRKARGEQPRQRV